MYKIMIVEDDTTITKVLTRQLQKWGYIVHAAVNFDAILEEFQTFSPHLVLLDISLPFFNGYHWCTEIRKLSQTPILFLSSASDDMSLVMAINLGADDFVSKPFNMDVVLAKIQAILRRTYSFGTDLNVLTHKGVTLNIGESTILYEDKMLELSKNEFKIMKLLMENKGNTVSRDHIIKKLWETESFIDDNTLTVNVNRLRRKLEGIGLSNFIITKKGIGYLVEA